MSVHYLFFHLYSDVIHFDSTKTPVLQEKRIMPTHGLFVGDTEAALALRSCELRKALSDNALYSVGRKSQSILVSD